MYNDIYFRGVTLGEEITEEDKGFIRRIDNTEFINKQSIITPYGNTNLENLSTGCKTLLNILHHPEIVFTVNECGDNVVDIIFEYLKDSDITIHCSRYAMPEQIYKDIQIDNDVITNIKDYRKWWRLWEELNIN